MRKVAPWVRAALSATLIALLYRRVPLDELKGLLTSIRPDLFAVVFVLTFGNTVISALKWRTFLRAAGVRIPLGSLVATYMTASFFNLFLPSNIGGDVYRVYDVRRSTGRGFDSLASVFADRLSGLLALFVLGLVFSLAGIRFLPDPRVVAIPAVLCAGVLGLVWMLRRQTPLHRLLALSGLERVDAVRRVAERFLSAISLYDRRPGLAARVMALSLLFQMSIIFSIWLLSRALGLEIRFLYFCIFVPVISVMEALPISIFGLGVRDAAYVFFFGQVGVERVEALSMAVVYVVLSLLYGAIGGLVFALRGARASRDGERLP